MSEEKKPLLSRKIMLNDDYSITLGRLLYTLSIAGVQILMFLAGNEWVFTPGAFAFLLSAIFSLRKDGKKFEDRIKFLEERIKFLEEKLI